MAGWWHFAQRPGSGIRAEGSSYSLLSFTRKAGQGVRGGLAAYTIGLGGYISGAATQTSSAVTSNGSVGVVPAVAAIAAVVMLAYPMTEERLREMVQEMAQRRAARRDTVEVRLGGGPEPATGDDLDQRGGTNQLVTNAHPTAKGAGRAPSKTQVLVRFVRA
jgi:hypothetical protein